MQAQNDGEISRHEWMLGKCLDVCISTPNVAGMLEDRGSIESGDCTEMASI